MITKEQVLEAQKKWGDAVVKIGSLKSDMEHCEKQSISMLRGLYAFDEGEVLFKPTKASKKQFRPSIEAALSYFIGGDSDYPEDHGFALKPWAGVRFENCGMILKEEHAMAMGNYYFSTASGEEVKAEFSLAYVLGKDGALLINLHHSSFPYSGY